MAWPKEKDVSIGADCDEARGFSGAAVGLSLPGGAEGFGSVKSKGGMELRTARKHPRLLQSPLTL